MNVFKKIADNYVMASNTVIMDSRLSWKAKGIYLYLIANGNNRIYTIKDVMNGSFKDGRHSTVTGIKELLKCGCLKMEYIKHYHFRFTLFDKPNHAVNK